jgi:hypothetical protein
LSKRIRQSQYDVIDGIEIIPKTLGYTKPCAVNVKNGMAEIVNCCLFRKISKDSLNYFYLVFAPWTKMGHPSPNGKPLSLKKCAPQHYSQSFSCIASSTAYQRTPLGAKYHLFLFVLVDV